MVRKLPPLNLSVALGKEILYLHISSSLQWNFSHLLFQMKFILKTGVPSLLDIIIITFISLIFSSRMTYFFLPKPQKKNINTIKSCLQSFSDVSKLNINFDKSKLWFSDLVPSDFQTYASNLLQVTISTNLGNYLGLPLKPFYKPSDFNFILDNMNKKLQG